MLEEVCDGGIPLTTEANVLNHIVPISTSWAEELGEMLKPKTNQPKTTSMQSNISRDIPLDALQQNWRPKDVTYAIQQVSSSISERLYIVSDEQGMAKANNCEGKLDCDIRVSGAPELTYKFTDPNIILDASLGKNVQIAAWNREKVLQATPMDGRQCLCQYKATIDVKRVPLEIRVDEQLKQGKKELQITVTQPENIGQLLKSQFGSGKIESIVVKVPLADYDMSQELQADGAT